MPKIKETPGTVLNALIKKHSLNYNRLANAIGLSSAMIRLIARDENPVSAPVAYRLAKFFKNKPEYWLALQMQFDIAKAAGNKKLTKELIGITTVDKAVFVRKKKAKKTTKTKKTAKSAGKKSAKTKTVRAKTAKPRTAKVKAAKAKASSAARRGRPSVTSKAKKTSAAKTTAKKASVKKGVKPAVKRPAAAKKPAPKKIARPVVRKTPQPKAEMPVQSSIVTLVDTTINEPQI